MLSRCTFVAFLALLIIVFCTETKPHPRILGGDDASSGMFPWMASIRKDGAHVCSGTLISNGYIITAAHCVSSAAIAQVTARVGSINQYAGGKIVAVESIVQHPFYGNFLHNIALLKLNQTLTFGDKINMISLAPINDVIEDGTSVTVAGWGQQQDGLSPFKLQRLTMSVMSKKECELQARYGYSSVICLAHAEKEGICRGDDGAGVVTAGKLVGVASFFFGACGTKYPDISSKISYYNSWINSVIEQK